MGESHRSMDDFGFDSSPSLDARSLNSSPPEKDPPEEDKSDFGFDSSPSLSLEALPKSPPRDAFGFDSPSPSLDARSIDSSPQAENKSDFGFDSSPSPSLEALPESPPSSTSASAFGFDSPSPVNTPLSPRPDDDVGSPAGMRGKPHFCCHSYASPRLPRFLVCTCSL
jgi:hypothetical protein